jgi:ribosome-binding protein aMBF1 (putative translation factor)
MQRNFGGHVNLEDYRQHLGWSQADLARKAELDDNTVRKAERGEEVTGRTARALTRALSEALGYAVTIQQIEGLRVKVYRHTPTTR